MHTYIHMDLHMYIQYLCTLIDLHICTYTSYMYIHKYGHVRGLYGTGEAHSSPIKLKRGFITVSWPKLSSVGLGDSQVLRDLDQ